MLRTVHIQIKEEYCFIITKVDKGGNVVIPNKSSYQFEVLLNDNDTREKLTKDASENNVADFNKKKRKITSDKSYHILLCKNSLRYLISFHYIFTGCLKCRKESGLLRPIFPCTGPYSFKLAKQLSDYCPLFQENLLSHKMKMLELANV